MSEKKIYYHLQPIYLKKIPGPSKTKEYYQSYLKKRQRNGEAIKNNCSTTKNCRKLRHC